MSAWVIGLGISIGYLMNKNHKLTSRIEDAVAGYENEHSANGTTGGSTSVEIKQVKNITSSVNCADINALLNGGDVSKITSAQEAASASVLSFDNPGSTPVITGVMLQMGV